MSELSALKDAAASDTKSSMGDKYETSREMINLEKGKVAEQLSNVEKMLITLKSIDVSKVHHEVQLGSIIVTDTGVYFLAVSLGQIRLEETAIFVISPVSPVGRELLGKKIHDVASFGGKIMKIKSIT